jgi:hypothetical protein
MGFSITKDISYFKILEDNTLLSKFSLTVLGPLLEQYEVLTKLINIYIKKVNKRSYRIIKISNHFSFGFKQLSDHQLPLIIAPKD